MKWLTISALVIISILSMLLAGCSQGGNRNTKVIISGDDNQVNIVCKPRNGE